MKVLFLDLDGVLNCDLSAKAYGTYNRFWPSCIAALNRIVSETGAKVVISSAWRLYFTLPQLKKHLSEQGFIGDVIDKTPHLVPKKMSLSHVPRVQEIEMWLDRHPSVDAWVVLDDLEEAGPTNLILTDDKVGLTEEDATAAIAILNADDAQGSDDPL